MRDFLWRVRNWLERALEWTRIAVRKVLAGDKRHGLLVRTGDGVLAVERLQLQFKKPLDWRSFLNGHPDLVGARLGG